jgi:recombination DNA repair RAD52 pathway protein
MNREILERAFPDALIRSRKGPFGQTFSYVEGSAYIARLNEAFEGEWSLEILEHHIRDTEVVVVVKLSAGGVTKMAFGGSSITVSREGEIVSIADDLKAAGTDALKKASSLFGVGLHLYSEPTNTETKPTRQPQPSNGGNGNGRMNGDRNSASGRVASPNSASGRVDRLTQKQLSAIWSMARALNLSADIVRERAVTTFGVVPEQLSKNDASTMITELGEALGSNGKSATP